MGYSIQSSDTVDYSNLSTVTGYTTSPATNGWYRLTGNVCEFHLDISGSAPTSNATTKTCTLPFAAHGDYIQNGVVVQAVDNTSTSTVGICRTRVSSNVLDIYPTAAAGNWTASGTGRWRLVISYKIA